MKTVLWHLSGIPWLLGLAAATLPALAAPPELTNVFSLRQQNSANSNNFATGEILFWGANSVLPNTSYGFTRQCPAGSSCTSPSDPDYVRQALFERPFTLLPNQYFASRPYDPALTGAWTLLVSSDPTFPAPASGLTTIVDTPVVGTVAQVPFVTSMSVTGAGLAPRISWTLPAASPASIDAVSVRVFDISHPVTTTSRSPSLISSFQQADFIYNSSSLLPTTSSFALPAGLLQYGSSYGISITLDHHRADGSTDSRSNSYFDFTPLNIPGAPNVYLPSMAPVPTTNGAIAGPLYHFNVPQVTANSVTFIDPLVASGFTYATGAGDPNFKSVKVPLALGDGLYDVYTFIGGTWTLVRSDLGVDEVFDFSAGGANTFQIRGIETGAAVNPFDVTAFVTGLSFVADGSFTGTMQAIVVDTSPVPEPPPGLLLLAGAVLVALRRARTTRSPTWSSSGPVTKRHSAD